jgi:hypothetical protein
MAKPKRRSHLYAKQTPPLEGRLFLSLITALFKDIVALSSLLWGTGNAGTLASTISARAKATYNICEAVCYSDLGIESPRVRSSILRLGTIKKKQI